MKRMIRLAALAMAAALLVAGCTKLDNELKKVPADSVTIGDTSITLMVGKTKMLTATVYPANSTDTVTWRSLKEDVATVDASGLVTAKSVGVATIEAVAGIKTAQCTVEVVPNDGSEDDDAATDYTADVYNNFKKNPDGTLAGAESEDGMLTIVNQNLKNSILVFDGEVESKNYIGTIKPSGSIKVELKPDEFHTINAVCKAVYEKNPKLVTKVTEITYYSDNQAYRIQMNPSPYAGGGTVIFNNWSDCWVAIESVDGSGVTYAVLQPNTQEVKLPMEFKKRFRYKIVYKKQITVGGQVIAMVDSTDVDDNGDIYLENASDADNTTIDINGPNTKDIYGTLKPMVYITNSVPNKPLQIYKGDALVAPNTADPKEYVLRTGKQACLTSWDNMSSSLTIGVSSASWGREMCTEDVKFENGKCYYVEVKENPEYTSGLRHVVWEVSTKSIADIDGK